MHHLVLSVYRRRGQLLPNPQTLRLPLIKTKLSTPQRRARLVPRNRLLTLLSEGSRRSLTLICAPAGYGKSTLLTEWIKQLRETRDDINPTICWLSLDEGDNDSILFLRYMVAAFENQNIFIGEEVQAMLEAFPTPPFQAILSHLINRLNDLETPSCLILDDYQFIANRAIHDGIAFLLDHLPGSIHLVIATRSDPPLPLAKLRVRNQLTEIRADELRFTQEEAGDFLEQITNLSLSVENIDILEQRTEGWIAGLQMAALAMHSLSGQEPKKISEFIQAFSGSHHYILDYLVEEVLSSQPDATRDFLMRSSILDRLCGSLCAAVLDLDPPVAQAILEHMERENLFLIPLDEERRWFRYHHLFADLLRTRLDHQYPAEAPKLHLRASVWFSENQWIEEAVHHAIASKDIEKAGRLMNQLAEPIIAQSGSFTLMRWIQQLPDAYVRTQPWLCIALGWSYGYMGYLEQQEGYLQEAENHFRPEDSILVKQEWFAQICALRSMIANTRGDFPETIRLGNQALDLISPDNFTVRVSVGYSLGRAHLALGDLTRADQMLWETSRLCMQSGIHHILAPTIASISKGYRLQGRLHDTLESLRSLQAYLEEHNPSSIYAAQCAYLGTIDVYREWNQLEQAEELARNALESLEPWKSHNCTCPCLVLLARILQAEGKFDEAHEMLKEASKVIQTNVPFGDVRSDLDAAWVNYWLAVGEISPAEQWMHEWRKIYMPSEKFSIVSEQNEISSTRVFIAKQQYEDAIRILSHLAESAEAGGRKGRLVEILVLQAVSFYESSEVDKAVKTLENCLFLAQPEGYLRIFLNGGETVKELLLAYQRVADQSLKQLVHHLLEAFIPSTKPAPIKLKPSGLVESLTERELEVLLLLAQGDTNREIAKRLFLAEGTVKYYVHVILEKLDVKTRTQAIVKARQIHLIQ
jgi:LuxR family maltose regulon positive regulatory protein